VSLHDLAMVARAEAGSAEAMDLLYRALAISRDTGLSLSARGSSATLRS
jgi:hypothetical protein